jgi:hypothetical protein
VHAYTSYHPFYAHMTTNTNSRYFVLRFPLKSENDGVGRPSAIAPVSWRDWQESSYSADRLLRVKDPRGYIDPDSPKDWTVQLLQWNAKGEYQEVHSWQWKQVDHLPFCVSNDGRYLALLEGGVKVLDTKTLEPVNMPGIDAMFKSALSLQPRSDEPKCLTQNLSYLVCTPAAHAPDGSLQITIDGKSYTRGSCSVFVERVTGKMGVIPPEYPGDSSETTGIVSGAAESNSGNLLLLYVKHRRNTDRDLYTIWEKGLAKKCQILAPLSGVPKTMGGAASRLGSRCESNANLRYGRSGSFQGALKVLCMGLRKRHAQHHRTGRRGGVSERVARIRTQAMI